MKTRVYFLALAVFCGFSFFACNNEKNAGISEENKFIESISPIGIDRLSPIAVSFISEPKGELLDCVKLSPNQKGTWTLEDKCAKFVPEKAYKANSKIRLTIDCGKLFGTGNSNEIYEQSFLVSIPQYKINFDEVRYNDYESNYIISGNVETDIPVNEKTISKTLKAKLAGKNQTVVWEKSDKDNLWNFYVKDISASNKSKLLKLKWTGIGLGLSYAQNKLVQGSKFITFPAKELFTILDINTSKPNTILVSFSKLLDLEQDITSFIQSFNFDQKLGGNYNVSVRENVLSIFSDNNFENIQTIALGSGIKSSDKIALGETNRIQLSDNWDLPEVSFANSNVILPTSQGSVFSIQTKNLSGVLIQVYEIYDRNMISFLQENELNGKNQLYKVGEPVWEKKVNFTWNDSMQNRFVQRGIDISDLVKKYPAGMFHIRISFRKDQVKYICHKGHGDFSSLPMPPDTIEAYSVPNQKSSWDYWDERNSNKSNYWSYRKDPCHPAFYLPSYNSSNIISRNILVSDLGIMAKKDVNESLYVTIADLRTAGPVAGANVQLCNYVGSVIASGKTDKDGLVVFPKAANGFLITANFNNQTSYLKISAGTNLSVSHFEIGGVASENGVKGFIYGERGVWRPGDDIYLTFVLQDLKNTLPKNIPVKFVLKDPLGHEAESRLLTESLNGFYPIKTKTSSESKTGNWTASVTIGGKTWSKLVKIETIIPNRLSVELETAQEYLSSKDNEFTLKSQWLNGAPTPNYEADVSVAFSDANTSFDSYSEYTFKNPLSSVDYTRKEIWSGQLGKDSKVNFTKSLNAGSNLPGKLNAIFVSKVYEPHGGFSTQSKSYVYSPFDYYVGLKLPKGDAARNMLLTDVDHTADVVYLDTNGKLYSGEKTLDYAVYKLEWKWWWEKDAYSSATYVSSRHYNKITSGSLEIKNGKGSFNFQIKYPDWGRYLVEVSDGKNGHKSAQIVYIDWPGWAGRAQEDGSGSSSMVPLTTSKKQYSVGESAEISFTSNSNSRALVTIEKSGTIVSQYWVETKNGSNVFRFAVTQDMLPNVYVHLTLLQPHLQTANSLPIRLYGLVPVNVTSSAINLDPVITTAEKFEPNKKASIVVSESSGKAMTYTVAVVDEGLLGITNYHTPNPIDTFYAKESSQLNSWDLYKFVINAYSGKLETLLAIGGSDELNNNNNQNQNRFAPVVQFFGPFNLAPGEKKETSFIMPSYVGAVRTMVVAGNKGAYGFKEKTTVVSSELMIQPSVPRTFGVNEKINLPVTVFNGENIKKNVKVNLDINGCFTLKQSKNITLEALDNQTVVFEVPVSGLGNAKIKTSATANGKEVTYSVEVPVESRGTEVTYRTPFVIKGGKTEEIHVNTPSDRTSTILTAELSPLPQVDLSRRLEYLISYPHGCIEQITSGAFPQLFIPSYSKLSNKESENIKRNIASVIERYTGYQTADGGFSYWPGQNGNHEWGTCYASHFMTEAKKAGYTIPDDLYNSAIEYIQSNANYWSTATDISPAVQAYRLFVLALAGKSNVGAMNRLSSMALSNEAKLLLASAYSQIGKSDVALGLLKAYTPNSKAYRNLSNDFGSNIREKAIYLYSVTSAGSQKNDSSKISKELVEVLNSDKWLSTQETAWSLYALLPYYTKQKMDSISYTLASAGQIIEGSCDKNSITEKLKANVYVPNQTVTVTNTGKAPIYGTIFARGKSIPGEEIVQNEGIKMSVSGLKSINNAKIGDECKISIKLTNLSSKNIENLALTVPIPSCLEFSNNRLADSSYTNSSFTYQDIRDNAIYTYFDLKQNAELNFEFNFTVSYSGEFYIPAIHAEAMYDNSFVAVNPGLKVNIKK